MERAFTFDVDGSARLADKAVAEGSSGFGGDLDAASLAIAFHSGGHVHRVTPNVIEYLALADDAQAANAEKQYTHTGCDDEQGGVQAGIAAHQVGVCHS